MFTLSIALEHVKVVPYKQNNAIMINISYVGNKNVTKIRLENN